MDLRNSNYIGPYRILGTIKTGQNSKVFTVINDGDQQRYALKILLSDFVQSKEHVMFMKHEYEVGRTLDHPHVIRLVDFRSDRGQSYLVMELFPHPNLKDWLLRGVDSFKHNITKIIDRAAQGLGHMHEKGWIHRDVKPDNFLVNEDGDVKLIDFALAQRKKTGLGRLFASKQKVQGTRSYMSPEQIRGQHVDARADIYSFACTLFHILGGQPPFTGTSSNDLLNKHLFGAIPSLEVSNPDVTPEFAALLKTMMAKAPEARPESMDQVLRDFRAISVFRDTTPRRVGRTPKNAG